MEDQLYQASVLPTVDHASRDSLRRHAVSQLQRGNIEDAIRSGLSSYRITKTLAALAPVPNQRYPHDLLPECLLLGKAYAQSQKADRAAYYLQQASAIAEENPYPEVSTNAALHSIVAELYMLLGLSDSAETSYNKYKAAVESGYGLNHLATSDCYNLLGAFYTHHGRYQPALTYCNRALEIRIRLLGPKHQNTSDSHYNLGLLYRLNGDPHDARAAFKLAREIRVNCFGEHALEVAEVDVSAGFTDHQLGRLDDAKRHYEHAYVVRHHDLGEYHPDTEEALSLLQAVRKSLGLLPIDDGGNIDSSALQLGFDLSQLSSRENRTGRNYVATSTSAAISPPSPAIILDNGGRSTLQQSSSSPLRNASGMTGSSALSTTATARKQQRSANEKIPLTLEELEQAIDQVNVEARARGVQEVHF